MKAVVSVIGKDRTGIIAAVAGALASREVNVVDISQTVMQGNFVMTMLVDASRSPVPLEAIGAELRRAVEPFGVTVHIQHEDLFKAMHSV